MANLNIPERAMQFKEGTVSEGLTMIGYSGGLIKDHFYWGDLAIDLQGMSIPKDRIPILENHDINRKIGFALREQIQINGALRVSGGTILDTEAGREFRRLSKEGYPYEASLYAKPSQIRRLREGEEVSVNGMAVQGPATIWQRCSLREISACTFGWDQDTSASAMSQDIHQLSVNVTGDVAGMIDQDERVANELFAMAKGQAIQERDIIVSAEDAQLAEDIFRLTQGHRV